GRRHEGASRKRRRAPLPLAGRGWGWGAACVARTAQQTSTPLPSPPPQGGRERACVCRTAGTPMNAPVLPRQLIASWPTRPDGAPATLIAALARNAHESSDATAFRERDYGIWQERTWSDVFGETLALAAALEEIGLGAGQALTVIGDNRTRLYLSMVAATALRAFPSPVFPDVPPEELTYYSRYGEPRIAIAEDQEQVDKLIELRARTGRPHKIVYDDPRGLSGYPADVVISYDELILRGQ